jgi:hypothetical protein
MIVGVTFWVWNRIEKALDVRRVARVGIDLSADPDDDADDDAVDDAPGDLDDDERADVLVDADVLADAELAQSNPR